MKEIRHIGIVVHELDKMMYFYKNIFNMKEISNQLEGNSYIEKILSVKEANLHTVKLKADDNSVIELLYYDNDDNDDCEKNIYHKGLSHIAITVNDLNVTYEKLKGMNTKFISKPVISPDNYAKVCFCQDPEGNFLELVEVIGGI